MRCNYIGVKRTIKPTKCINGPVVSLGTRWANIFNASENYYSKPVKVKIKKKGKNNTPLKYVEVERLYSMHKYSLTENDSVLLIVFFNANVSQL